MSLLYKRFELLACYQVRTDWSFCFPYRKKKGLLVFSDYKLEENYLITFLYHLKDRKTCKLCLKWMFIGKRAKVVK